ncbi:hypothetical protein [Streptomyces sp. NPDC101115]|uniref:hypothetical protein n=1 Tax=Streptomyces sp. NPDC101115 TaxID=3366106 RepID=UPI003830D8E2
MDSTSRPTRYHYVLTVEIPGVGLATSSDVVTVDPGTTRSTVYGFAVERAVEGIMRRASPGLTYSPPITRFWSLDDNAL